VSSVGSGGETTKITEVIAVLQTLLEKHGDLNVYVNDSVYDNESIIEVRYRSGLDDVVCGYVVKSEPYIRIN